MAGEENLIPFNELTEEKQRELASKGGKASVEARRKKKSMREQAELLLSLSVQNPKLKQTMKQLGIKEEDQTNQMAMIISMLNVTLKGSKGSVQAFNSLQATIGEKPIEEYKFTDMTNKKFDDICSQVGGDGLNE